MRPLAEALARGLLIALALLLPFEAPLCHVGPLQLTTVEVALYAMLAAWGAATGLEWLALRPARERVLALLRAAREPLVAATLVWTVALLTSAFAASSYRGPALKFALRSLSGILVFFAARSLARPTIVARRVLLALVAGALVSAATAMLEVLVPSTEAAWSLFRDVGFNAFALPRATGVFAYPTIGAMYWEAAVPLLLVASALAPDGEGATRRALLAMGGSALLFGAILASATRSSLASAAIACAALFLLTRRWGGALPRSSVGALLVLVATSGLVVVSAGSGSLVGQRLRFWEDSAWFGVEYDLATAPRSVEPGDLFTTPVTLRNTGTLTWLRGGAEPTRLTHHWYLLGGEGGRGASQVTTLPSLRTGLPADVPPGDTVQVSAVAQAPTTRGRYALAWDLVEEHVTFFSERGSAMAAAEIDVGVAEDPAGGAGLRGGDLLRIREATAPPPPGRLALWRAARILWRAHPLLGAGPDSFRRMYEGVLSPAPMGQPYTDERIHANSLYFETLADLGVAGAVALGALMVALLLAVRANLAGRDVVGLGFGVAAVAFFVHGLSDYFLEFTPTFGLFWMLLGLAAAATSSAPPGMPRSGTPPRAQSPAPRLAPTRPE